MGKNDFDCTGCGATIEVGVMGKPKMCPYCNAFTASAFAKENKLKHSHNPKCPNPECNNSDGSMNPQESFTITQIKQGLMGKVFRDHGANMVSCAYCGHIIGVGSMG